MDDLIFLMQKLRDPEKGCPWDLEQTFESLASHTLEEAYEVIDALAESDFPHLREELGDLLLQIIFHSQIASEQSLFSFEDVVHSLVEKLIRRHPHVFENGQLHESSRTDKALTAENVMEIWQKTKAQEKQAEKEENDSVLHGITRALPALKRAQKIQEKAAYHGFDWRESGPVFEKIREEIRELEVAYTKENHNMIQDEMGDILFSMVNLARHLKLDAEYALDNACRKFTQRFSFIEKTLSKEKRRLEDCTLQELNSLWDEAKLQE